MSTNGYEFLLGKIFIYPTDTSIIADKRFLFVDRNGALLTEPPPMAEATLYLMYRKTSDSIFRIPSDIPDDLPNFRDLSEKSSANFARLANGRSDGSPPRERNWLRRALRIVAGD